MELFSEFALVFIPLFVAMDAVGVVPLFISISAEIEENQRRSLVNQATLTAFFIAILFLATGNMIFSFLGISACDFRIAGGIVLLVLSISDLLFSQEEKRRAPVDTIGVVPIGIPLIMGPAALTTILILIPKHGLTLTLISLLANLIIVWVCFRYSRFVLKLIGHGGAKAVAKVMALFLAGIGVMMIRLGVQECFTLVSQ